MSQPRLHEQLISLFSERSSRDLKACLEHPDFTAFMREHDLQLPLEELVLAFTHTSFSHEYEVPHQELSEFFGDAVVQLIITAELMKRYPAEKEGRLSKLRSSIVNEKTLAQVASHIKLQEFILVGKGEFKKELYLQDTVLSDTFEALMAKIFKFHGLEFASAKLLTWLTNSAPEAFNLDKLDNFDSKSKLQEATLAKYKTLPRYSADILQEGFLVKLWVNDSLITEGVFPSKKTGERELARKVLENKDF